MDVDDWKKHTDYRGYTESDDVVQWFWKVCLTPRDHVDYRRYGLGTQRKSLDYYSLRLELHESLSMGSRIYKAVTDHVDSPSRKLEI